MKNFGLSRRANAASVVAVAPQNNFDARDNSDSAKRRSTFKLDNNDSNKPSYKDLFLKYLFSENKILAIVLLILLMTFLVVLSQTVTTIPAINSPDMFTAIKFQLISSISVVLDIGSEMIFQRNDFDLEICHIVAFVLFFIPNLLIFLETFTCCACCLVIYYQFCCLVCVLAYKVQSLAEASASLNNNYFNLVGFVAISSIVAFFFNLARHDAFPGTMILKILFAISLVFMEGYAIVQTTMLIRYSYRFKKNLYYVPARRMMFFGFLFLLFLTILPVVGFLITFGENNFVFFPMDMNDNFHMVYFMAATILGIVMAKNFEIRDDKVTTRNQLEQHRKLTRSISHEIRTPLNTAFMALELLQDGMKYPNRKESEKERVTGWLENVDNVREACDIAMGILNQLLTFDKLASGMLTLEKKITPVTHLLEVNAKLFRMQAIQGGISFGVDMNSEEKLFFRDIVVQIDEFKINQVLRNLLSNAMKFTPKKGSVRIRTTVTTPRQQSIRNANDFENGYAFATPSFTDKMYVSIMHGLKYCVPCHPSWGDEDDDGNSISVSARSNASRYKLSPVKSKSATAKALSKRKRSIPQVGPQHVDGCKYVGTLRIAIIDNGPGIAKEDQSKLFQEYVQISPGELQKGQGSGLGLSISKSIMTLHGGKIGVRSSGKLQGSTFFIELPAYRCTSMNNTNDQNNLEDADVQTNSTSTNMLTALPNGGSSSMKYESTSPQPTRSQDEWLRQSSSEKVIRTRSKSRAHLVHLSSKVSSMMLEDDVEEGGGSGVMSGVEREREGEDNDDTYHDRFPSSSNRHHRQLQQQQHHRRNSSYDREQQLKTNLRSSMMMTFDTYEQYENMPDVNGIVSASTPPSSSLFDGIGVTAKLSTHAPSIIPANAASASFDQDENFGTIAIPGATGTGIGGSSSHHYNNRLITTDYPNSFQAMSGSGKGSSNTNTNTNTSNHYEVQVHPSPESNRLSMNNNNISAAMKTRFGSHSFNRKLTVLICDDSPMNRKMLAKLLTRDGHTVIEADDGTVAVEYIRSLFAQQQLQLQQQASTSQSPPQSSRPNQMQPEEQRDTLRIIGSDGKGDENRIKPSVDRVSDFNEDVYSSQKLSSPPSLLQAQPTALMQAMDNFREDSMLSMVSPRANTNSDAAAVRNSSTNESNSIMQTNTSSKLANNNNSNNNALGSDSAASSAPPPAAYVVPIDIILIDNLMKEMDGPQAVKIIRRLGFTGPMLGVTGSFDEECDAFIQSGIDLILRKPVNMVSLWNALKSMKYV